MKVTHAVRSPKKGVISCWVCTGVLVVVDVLRRFMLRGSGRVGAWIFLILIIMWGVISVYETIKYMKMKRGVGEGNGREKQKQ